MGPLWKLIELLQLTKDGQYFSLVDQNPNAILYYYILLYRHDWLTRWMLEYAVATEARFFSPVRFPRIPSPDAEDSGRRLP